MAASPGRTTLAAHRVVLRTPPRYSAASRTRRPRLAGDPLPGAPQGFLFTPCRTEDRLDCFYFADRARARPTARAIVVVAPDSARSPARSSRPTFPSAM